MMSHHAAAELAVLVAAGHVLVRERARWSPHPGEARMETLAFLPEDELEHLRALGVLDDLPR